MKNLLIYVNPSKTFDDESEKLIKIQIDNSLALGWKHEDIVLVTNFQYEYGGVRAHVVDRGYFGIDKEASKITTIVHLFDIGFFDTELYWCHDLDAYQLEPITEPELGLDNLVAGFNDYCRSPRWQLGSFFFKKGAEHIFRDMVKIMIPKTDNAGKPYDDGTPLDEYALMFLTDNNINNINTEIKRLNGTYDFGMRRVDYCYDKADKPLKVLHFHPRNPLINTLAIAMYGKNRIGKPLMNDRLIKIFNKYGYR